jgi:hypothetical protein
LYSERTTRKAMSGGSVMTLLRCANRDPRELKMQEGNEWSAGLNRLTVTTNRNSDQSPEGGVGESGTSGATYWEEKLTNDKRARQVDEAGRLSGGKNP